MMRTFMSYSHHFCVNCPHPHPTDQLIPAHSVVFVTLKGTLSLGTWIFYKYLCILLLKYVLSLIMLDRKLAAPLLQ